MFLYSIWGYTLHVISAPHNINFYFKLLFKVCLLLAQYCYKRYTYLVGRPNTVDGGILLIFWVIFSFPESFFLTSWVALYWKCSLAEVRPTWIAPLFRAIKSLADLVLLLSFRARGWRWLARQTSAV